jgi:hypothetical protein
MPRPAAVLLIVLTLTTAAMAGWWWWSSPERQIRAILTDVAVALTSDAGEDSLDTLAGAATLQSHVKDEVEVWVGEDESVQGRDAVVSAAARFRARQPVRVRFFDTRIGFDGEDAATVVTTAEIVRMARGETHVEVYEVIGTLRRRDGRWLVSTARASAGRPS